MLSKAVLILSQEETSSYICSPSVGIFTPLVEEEFPVKTGTLLGTIEVLGQKVQLFLPPGFQGKILAKKATLNQALGYGTPLFSAELTNAKKQLLQNQREGTIVVTSPMAGVFYRRGAPNQPCFVNENDLVKQGQTLGLVEQMKSFNRVSFHSDSEITEGKVIQILVEDQAEVEQGTPLFMIEPPSTI